MNAISDNSPHAAVLAQDLRALMGKLRRRLREQGNAGDLTPSQVSVVLRLEKDGPATASALARAEGMRPQSIVPVIGALEDAGLVSGAADPADGRQTLLSLTASCRRLLNRPRRAAGLADPKSPGAPVAQEQDTLAQAIELLKRLVDD